MTFPPYTYPDSSVLINRRNIRDAATLETLERKTTLLYLSEMADQVIGDFDVVHLKRIHYILFHDLYAWAGQFRLVDIGKEQTLFCRAAFLDGEAERIVKWIRQHHYLRADQAEPFAQQAGELMTHLNMLHPFREGNGRTQREFVRQLARFQGFMLDYRRMDVERYMAASTGDDPREMAAALRPTIVNPIPDRILRAQYQSVAEQDWER